MILDCIIFSPRCDCYLASDSAPLVVCDLPEQLLRMGLLLLVLPALSLQLLELKVLKTLRLSLEHLTVLTHKHKHTHTHTQEIMQR